jgi:cold shock CspA family protein
MRNGIIKKKTDKGFGFITPEGEDKDLFFHGKCLVGIQFDELNEGDCVNFETEVTPKGSNAVRVSPEWAAETKDELPSDELPSDELPSDEESPKEEVFAEEVIGFALFGDKWRVVSLAPDGNYRFLDEAQNRHNYLYVFSSETIALQIAVEELEYLVNSPNSKEKDFQDFFDRHRNFILNDEYKDAHPHIALTKDDGESLIPDFILEPIYQNSLCDLLELKLPTAQIFVLKKKRMRFSAAVLEACAQLREYREFFNEEKNRRKIQEDHGLLAFKPKMFVIIGRRGDVNPIDVRNIESDVPNLNLLTYDDVITRTKAKVEAMKARRK